MIHARMSGHFSPSSKKKPVTKWIFELREEGLEPDVILLARLSEPSKENERHTVANASTWGHAAGRLLEDAFINWLDAHQPEPLLNIDKPNARKRGAMPAMKPDLEFYR